MKFSAGSAGKGAFFQVLLYLLLISCITAATTFLLIPDKKQTVTQSAEVDLKTVATRLAKPLSQSLARFGFNNAIQVINGVKQTNHSLDYYLYKGNTANALSQIIATGSATPELVLKEQLVSEQNGSLYFKPLIVNQKTIGLLIVEQISLPADSANVETESVTNNQYLIIASVALLILIPFTFLILKTSQRSSDSVAKKLLSRLKLIVNDKDFDQSLKAEYSADLNDIAEQINRVFDDINSANQGQDEQIKKFEELKSSMEGEIKTRTYELEKAKIAAEHSSEAKSTFLTTMSHEIRTPMNGIIGTIDLLRHTELNGAQHRLSSTIRESAFSLLKILDDILDFSKIEAGKMKIESIPFSVTQITEEVARVMASIAQKSRLEFNLRIDPRIPSNLLGDPVRVRQVLYNLCSNAIKFTPTTDNKRGVIKLDVSIAETSLDFYTIEFKVTDNGKGMTAQQVGRIFHPFSQAEESITREYGGTGLGLSICKRLTELMFGHISVDSEAGLGSEFTVSIPLHVHSSTQADREGILKDRKVAVCSSNPHYQNVIKEYVKFLGAECKVFSDINQAETWSEMHNLIWVIDSVSQINEANSILTKISNKLLEFNQQAVVLSRLSDAKTRYQNVYYFNALPVCKTNLYDSLMIAAGLKAPKKIKVKESLNQYPSVEKALNQNKLILLVEDNVMNQQVICDQLNMLGYGVEVADNGEEGLKKWREKAYSLVLTDLHMPKMSGYELAEEIRRLSMDEFKDRPMTYVVAITANALKGEKNKCIAAGMNDYLTKPVELNTLEQTMKKWLPEEPTESSSPTLSDASIKDTTTTSPINFQLLDNYLGTETSKRHKYLNMFLEQGESLIADINNAVMYEKFQSLESKCHQLKSIASSIGAEQLASAAKKLEAMSKEGTPMVSEVEHTKDVIEQHYTEVKVFIEQYLAEEMKSA